MRKIFTLLCVALCATSLFANVVTGTCGDNLQWSYDTDTKALTITGSGDMYSYWGGDAPWFQINTSIMNIYLPEELTSIGSYAFSHCTSITSITIPDGVEYIGECAFWHCESLVSADIPNSIRSLGSNSFSGCYSLESINLPYGLTAINYETFYNCQSLTSITIPNSVVTLSMRAFSGCESLTSISIPESVISIGSEVFYGCSLLKEIVVGSNVSEIQGAAFLGIDLIIMKGVNPPMISSNTISPNSIVYIPCSAEENYHAAPIWQFLDLRGVNYMVNLSSNEGGSVRIVENDCESNSTTIEAFPELEYEFKQWNDGNTDNPRILTLTQDTTFSASFVLSEHYRGKCGENLLWAFDNGHLSITGTGAMHLESYPAWNDYSKIRSRVTTLSLPEGITSIDDYAFAEMSLTDVVVPASVTYFGEQAFADNECLTRFEYLGTTAEYDYYYYEEGYYDSDDIILRGCDNLRYFKGETKMLSYSIDYLDTIIITGGEGFEDFYENVSYVDNSKSDDKVIGNEYDDFYVKHIETLYLPVGLQEIGDHALMNARYLSEITIPAGVTRIGESAFEECRSLDSVTFAGTALREIDDWAFYNCHKLQHVTIPEGVTEIGEAAFFDCTYLDELTLPASMEYIADNGFALCAKLRRMNVNATTPPQVEARTFEDVDRTIPVVVPDESVSVYKSAPVWQEFNIVGKSGVPAALDNIPAENSATRKLLRDGHLVIIRDGVEYNVMGQQL